MYKHERFEVRPLDEIKQDIDAMAALCEDLRQMSWKLGQGERITRDAAVALIDRHPELNYHHGFAMVFHWLTSGAQTAFIQDANSLIMKTDQLVEALRHLRRTFPSLTRVTSYARSRTLSRKSHGELAAIREAGLDRVHVGMESGDDGLLAFINKGVTAEGHIQAGRKALAAGFELSEYWIPGLGGKTYSKAHARNTARVLNAIDPHYIRSRPLHPMPGTPLQDAIDRGEMQVLSPAEQLQEIREMIAALTVGSRVCFDHAGNYWKNGRGQLIFSHSYEGYPFPQAKATVLGLIDEGLAVKTQPSRLGRL